MVASVTTILGLGHEVGDAVARRLIELGHNILAADSKSTRIEKAKTTIPESAIFHHGDLHTRLGLRNCFATVTEEFGRLDNVVVIPEIPEPTELAALNIENFDKDIVKACRGAALTMQVFSERMSQQEPADAANGRAKQKGTVTFILSDSAMASMPGRFNETVTQSAILGTMRAGALELAASGIRVNAIVAIRPRAETIEPWLKRRTPLGRAALADEIADLAGFLTSPSAAIITGEAIRLDGGRSALSGLL